MSNNIRSLTGRRSLPVRREPFWERLAIGFFLGYRQLRVGEQGTWCIRLRKTGGRQRYHHFGSLADIPANQRYDEAKKMAFSWLADDRKKLVDPNISVGEVCRRYVKNLAIDKSEAASKDAEGRFNRLVFDKPIASIPIKNLISLQVKDWFTAQTAESEDSEKVRRSKDSANRNLASFKAALNWAVVENIIATDSGWKVVCPHKKVGSKREDFLLLKQRTALLNACAPDLQVLITAMIHTCGRPGELASATIADFNQEQGILRLDGKTGERYVVLSTEAVKFFTEISRTPARIAASPLCYRENKDGRKNKLGAVTHFWDRNSWKAAFRKGIKKSGLDKNISLYAIRHSSISEQLTQGADIFEVAQRAGTSILMVQKHYGHLDTEKTRSKLDRIPMF